MTAHYAIAHHSRPRHEYRDRSVTPMTGKGLAAGLVATVVLVGILISNAVAPTKVNPVVLDSRLMVATATALG